MRRALVVLALIGSLAGCSAVQEQASSLSGQATDKAKSAAADAAKAAQEKAMEELTKPENRWLVGCTAVGLGLSLNSADRAHQQDMLRGVAKAAISDPAQAAWANQAISLLALTDPTKAPDSVKKAVGAPCREHGHPVAALGG